MPSFFVVSTLQAPCSILFWVRSPARIRPEGVATEYLSSATDEFRRGRRCGLKVLASAGVQESQIITGNPAKLITSPPLNSHQTSIPHYRRPLSTSLPGWRLHSLVSMDDMFWCPAVQDL